MRTPPIVWEGFSCFLLVRYFPTVFWVGIHKILQFGYCIHDENAIYLYLYFYRKQQMTRRTSLGLFVHEVE